jgi:hypothetical protein
VGSFRLCGLQFNPNYTGVYSFNGDVLTITTCLEFAMRCAGSSKQQTLLLGIEWYMFSFGFFYQAACGDDDTLHILLSDIGPHRYAKKT